jgi:hypothetical protein
MSKCSLPVLALNVTLLLLSAAAGEISVYDVAEGDLFETRLSGHMVLKSTIYSAAVDEALVREDGSFERMIKEGKVMLLHRGDQLRVISSGSRPVPCTVIRKGKEIGKWLYPMLFFSDDMKRLNQLSDERAEREKGRNAPHESGLGPLPPLKLNPAVAKRAREQDRKDAIRGAEYRTWSSYAGMMIEAEFGGLAGGKVTLTKRDGSKVLTPLDDLFVEDQEWIAKAIERKAAIEKAKWRTWTDSTGKHETEAKFGGVMQGKGGLIKRDGSTIQVPLEKLSDEDQEWIVKRKK